MEADRLKTVIRGNRIADGSRHENTAEHSWHLALFAMVLSEHAVGPVDVWRVVQMLLLHDLVEIEAGDTPLYDLAARRRGRPSASRLPRTSCSGCCQPDQGPPLRADLGRV